MTDSSFPLDIVNESDMTPELDTAIRECLCVCFPDDAAVFSRSRAWHGTAPEYTLLYRDGGQVVGHVGVIVREVRVGAELVRVAGIQNMAIRPQGRKSGLGAALMTTAMDEAARRGVPFGILFCVPELERYYARYHWIRRDVDVRMNFDGQRDIPIPGKNICMVKRLADRPFPEGGIHLQGADW